MKSLALAVAVVAVGCSPMPSGDGGTGGGAGGGSVVLNGNLVSNPSFEDGDLDGWYARDGAIEVTSDAHTGLKAARLKVPANASATTTITMTRDVATALGTNTYCGTLFAKGTCQVRLLLRAATGGGVTDFTFDDEPSATAYARVPPHLVVTVPGNNADRLLLLIQTRAEQAGDTLDIDDVDVWISPSGKCDEIR